MRTERNVKDSDATLILNQGLLTGGTALTLKLAKINKKPYWVVDLSKMEDPVLVKKWILHGKVNVLNVAGPPESNRPGIYDKAIEFLRRILQDEQNGLLRR